MIPPRRTYTNRGPMAGQRRRTRVFQSLRLGGFWSKLQAPFRFASLLLWPWLKARMSLRALDLVMGSPTAPAGRGCVVVASHHGDHGLARAFLAHHRRLGAKHFVFLDLSVDGGLAAFLEAERGCTVWRPRPGLQGGRALDWLNGLRGRYATGRWCLSLSTTDLFVFYRCEQRRLPDFTDFLDSEARDHVYALVVEMYGERPAAELAAEGAEPAALDRFDAFGFVTLDPGRFRNVIVRGGLQRRMLHRTKPRRSPALNRVPLVKWQWFYGYMAGTRLIVPAYLNTPHTRWHSSPTGCILRYALLAGPETLAVAARHEAAVTLKDGGLAAYPGLLKLRDTAPLQDASRRYRTTRDLVDAGLLNPGQWF